MTEDVEAIAGKLTKGAARACRLMTDTWQFAGKGTFNSNGAWALYHQRGVGGRGSIAQMEAQKDGKWSRHAYRLTPLGLAVRSFLASKED